MHNYKAIIFDLGKVVFDLSFDNIFQSWANASGKDFSEIKNRFLFDEVIEQFEKAEITATEFRREISYRLGMKITDKEFDKGWCSLYLDCYKGVDSLLSNLKRNFQLVALTNTNLIHSKVSEIKYAETFKKFEKIFSSHEIKERKPDPKAYQTVLDYLQLEPQQTIFLDDNMENIKAAEQLGIKSILVTSFEQLPDDLQKLGLKFNFLK